MIRRYLPDLAFWMGATILVAMGLELYASAGDSLRSWSAVSASYDVVAALSSLEERLSRAESSQRAYVLTGDGAFLAERDQLLRGVAGTLARLETAIHADSAHTANLQRLRELIVQRVAIMKRVATQKSRNEEIDPAVLRSGLSTSSAIDALTDAMQQVEQRKLIEKQHALNQKYRTTTELLLAAAVLAMLIVAPAYIAYVVQRRARRAVENRLLDMSESIAGAVYRMRTEPGRACRFEFLSAGVEALYGIARDTVLRHPDSLIAAIHPEDRPRYLAAVEDASAKLAPLRLEYRTRFRDGTEKWVRAAAAPRAARGGGVLWNGHWADATEQKALEAELHDAKEEALTASRAKSTFLAVMSHEIRTPLNGVLGMLEILALTRLDAEQRATLNVVRESGRSLQRIIDDILDFSKIEAGRLELAPTVASVQVVLENTRNVYGGNASSKGLLLTYRADPRIAAAHRFDPLRLGQILNNFVSNAIKFTHDGGISIDAELVAADDGHQTIAFRVRDTGIGMAADVRERLFEPFMQAGPQTTRSYGGTGLGLTICRRLAALMGATVDVDSAPGAGTTMTLTLSLPIADPRELAPADAKASTPDTHVLAGGPRIAPPADEAARNGTLVLVVDDHPTNRMLLCRQTNLLGYAAESASDGAAALEKWRSGRYGAVITDCNMPVMDGYTLARSIRSIERAEHRRHTPIVACTANAMRGEAEACLAAGMDDYLAKPIQLGTLARALRQWLPAPADEPPTHAAAPSRPAGGDVIDVGVLAELGCDAPETLREILRDFQRVNDADRAALEAAAAAGDLRTVARVAHRIKGAARSIGAEALASACEAVGSAARAADAGETERRLPALRVELARLADHIASV